MRLETLRIFGPNDMEEEHKRLLEKYDNLDSLAQKATIIGCTRPAYVDDYMLLKALSSRNPAMQERHIFTGSEIFEFLTPRRMDMLDYLKRNEPTSITLLARDLKRNYKNVYDDLRALEDAGLVVLRRERNRKVPRLNVTEIRITVDGGVE